METDQVQQMAAATTPLEHGIAAYREAMDRPPTDEDQTEAHVLGIEAALKSAEPALLKELGERLLSEGAPAMARHISAERGPEHPYPWDSLDRPGIHGENARFVAEERTNRARKDLEAALSTLKEES